MKTAMLFLFVPFLFLAGCGKKKEVPVTETIKEEVREKNADQKKDSIKTANTNEAGIEDAFNKDTLGQWAIKTDASTNYSGGERGVNAQWSPEQMIGQPNTKEYGDYGTAWAPSNPDQPMEWVKLEYTRPVNASEVRVRQNIGPGVITKVELIDDKGKSHIVWSGTDRTNYKMDKPEYFVAKFDKTPYKTKSVKITMQTEAVLGWNEIDAVQLVGE